MGSPAEAGWPVVKYADAIKNPRVFGCVGFFLGPCEAFAITEAE